MKKVLLFVLMVMLFSPLAMRGQTTVTIGTGTTPGPGPFQASYTDSWSESIYSANEIGIAGTITAVAYNLYPVEGSSYQTQYVKIYMGTRSTTSFSGYSNWTSMADLTEVYSSAVTLGGGSGWETFQLTTPFDYNGTDNLVIVVSHHAYNFNNFLFYLCTESQSLIYLYRNEDDDETYAQHPGTASGEGYYRPNIQLTINAAAISCPAPTDVVMTDVDANSGTLSWTAGGTEASWDILLSTTALDPDSTTQATYTSNTASYTFQNLTASTQYYAYVRANCGTNDVSIWKNISFMTSQIPATLPYAQDWETASENAQWTIDNGDQTNQWYIGTGANNTPNGSQALYISDNEGASPSYTNSATSSVWAYRDINFGTEAEYQIAFDFKGVAEANDYLSVYLGAPATPSGNTAPEGATLLGQYNLKSDFETITNVVNSSYTGVQRLYFLWYNNGGTGNNPPAIVDNITVTAVDCGTPYNLVLDNATAGSLTFHFTPALATDNGWEAVILGPGETLNELMAVDLTNTTHTFTGLEANTLYSIYVRTNCGGATSSWSQMLEGRTACPEYMTIPFAENFDTYGTGNSHYPICWERESSYSTGNYPYISTTNYSAPGSLYFYATSSTNNVIMLPELSQNVALNTLTLSFMFRSTGITSAYAIQVGVVENSDASTFTLVETITSRTANTWEEFEVSFANYAGNGNQLAFKYTPGGTYGCYVDNVNVYATPSCLKPMDVATYNVTATTANVSWTARNSENHWQVVAVPHNANPSTGTPIDVYTNPCQIGNLQENTQYDLYVKAVCDDEEASFWSTVITFSTKCVPTSTLPYMEDFQSYGAGDEANFPNCWTRHCENSPTTSYPYINTTTTGENALYFYSTSSIMSYATTQTLDLSNATPGTLVLSFDVLKPNTNYGRLDVGYMTDADDMGTFHLLKAIYPTDYAAMNTWYHYEVVLPDEAYTSNVFLAFRTLQSGTNYVYLANVVVDYGNTCMAPTNLKVSNITGSSALVSWNEVPGVSEYVVAYSEQGQDDWQSQTVTGNQFMIPSLTSGTSYEVRLFCNCETATSDTLTKIFTTGCMAGGEQIVGEGTTGKYDIPMNTFYKYSYVQQMFTADELDVSGEIRSIAFQYINSTEQTKDPVTIYLAETEQESLTTWIPVSSMQQVFSGSVTLNNSGTDNWLTIPFDTVFEYSGSGNLVVAVLNNTGSYVTAMQNTFYTHPSSGMTIVYNSDQSPIDPATGTFNATAKTYRNNVKFGTPCDNSVTCVEPNMYVSSFDNSSVEIAWAPGYEEESWEMEYKLASESEWTPEGTVISSPHVISGLSAGSTYDIRMRSFCNAASSEWASVSVNIPCFVSSLPYIEDFDNPYTGSTNYDNFVNCWNRKTNHTSQYPYCSTTQHYSGVYSLYFYGSSSAYSLAVTPRFDDAIVMDSLQIQFMALKTNASYFVEVGVMSDPEDPSTFTLIGQFNPTANNTWERAEFNTSEYVGSGRHIAFRAPQWASNYIYIDDVNIYYIPVCAHVENVVADTITQHTADISWTPVGDENSWEVLYGTNVNAGFDLPITVDTNFITLTDLASNTLYEVYVRAKCDEGEYSSWMNISFRTGCEAISTLPFVEDFETYNGGASSNNVTPSCWSRINTGLSASGCPTVYNSSTYAASGSKVLFFYAVSSSSYSDQYSILPEINTDELVINTLRLSFKARRYSNTATYQNLVIVGVMTDNTDASTFVPVDTIELLSTTIERYYVDFANYTGLGSYIALKVPQPLDLYSFSYIYLDDITLNISPACGNPTDLTATVTSSNSAQISWNDEETEYTWELLVAPSNVEPDFSQAQTVQTNSYTTNNLLGNTAYTVYVRTQCSNGNGYSEWVSSSFSTPSDNPALLPYNYAFEDEYENAEWVFSNNTSGNNWYIGVPVGAEDSVLYVSGDNGVSTTYVHAAGQVWAYRDIQLSSAAEYEVKFKWACAGENEYDYMYAFLGDPNEVTASTTTANITAPNNSVQLGGANHEFVGNGTGTWFSQVFDSSVGGGIKRLYFAWRNDGSGGTPPAIRIDSVVVMSYNCGRPQNLEVVDILPTAADLTFTPALSTDAAWEYVITTGTNPDDITLVPVEIDNTSFTISNLDPNTTYRVYVRTDCGSEHSQWSAPVLFTTLPMCPAPTQITVDVTTTTADLSWSENGTATNWTVEYGLHGFTQGTGTVISVSETPSCSITGLTASTLYDVYVFSNCSTTDTSAATLFSFATECGIITDFPYTEDFEATNNLPTCWTNINVTGTTNWTVTTPSQGSTTTAHSGTHAAVFFQGDDGDIADLQMPIMDLSNVENPYLSFWYANNPWEADIDRLTVYYRTSETDSWTQLSSYIAGVDVWTFDSLALPNPSATYQIKFNADSYWGYGVKLDDVTVASGGETPVEPCDVPTNLAVSNVSQTSATATWTAGGSETAWNVQIKEASASDWGNSINVTAATYTFSGLTANTAYQVRVQAVCTEDLTSDWSALVSFTTLEEEEEETCPAPTGLEATDVQNETITLTWSQEANTANNWTVQYRVAGTDSWSSATATAVPYTLTGLTGLTTYEIQVVANCTNGLTSDPSNMLTVTTTNTGINGYDLESSVNLYPNPTASNVTISAQGMMESVSMYDVYGKLISTIKVEGTTTTVDLSNYASGVYFARITTENGVVTKRIVKK